MLTHSDKMHKLNQFYKGRGYQVRQAGARIRVENECGEFLFYSRTLESTIERIAERERGEKFTRSKGQQPFKINSKFRS